MLSATKPLLHKWQMILCGNTNEIHGTKTCFCGLPLQPLCFPLAISSAGYTVLFYRTMKWFTNLPSKESVLQREFIKLWVFS